MASPVVNWASEKSNGLTRPVMAAVADIDRDAELPKFHTRTFVAADRGDPQTANAAAPAYGKRKVALFATCFVNYNKPRDGHGRARGAQPSGRRDARRLSRLLRHALPRTGRSGTRRARTRPRFPHELVKLIDEGYDIVTLTASCGLMFKFEWPLIVPDNADVKKLAENTFDIDEYVVDVAKKDGLPDGLSPLPEGVTVHLPCHARAQNMGPKSAEMLKLIPDTPVDVIERCSGHGGTFGVLKETHRAGQEDRPARVPHRRNPGPRAYRIGLPAGGSAYPERRARSRGQGGQGTARQDPPSTRSRSSPAPMD